MAREWGTLCGGGGWRRSSGYRTRRSHPPRTGGWPLHLRLLAARAAGGPYPAVAGAGMGRAGGGGRRPEPRRLGAAVGPFRAAGGPCFEMAGGGYVSGGHAGERRHHRDPPWGGRRGLHAKTAPAGWTATTTTAVSPLCVYVRPPKPPGGGRCGRGIRAAPPACGVGHRRGVAERKRTGRDGEDAAEVGLPFVETRAGRCGPDGAAPSCQTRGSCAERHCGAFQRKRTWATAGVAVGACGCYSPPPPAGPRWGRETSRLTRVGARYAQRGGAAAAGPGGGSTRGSCGALRRQGAELYDMWRRQV